MPVERKVIGTDANGQPIYAGDAYSGAPPTPTVTLANGQGGAAPGGTQVVGVPGSPQSPGEYISKGLEYISPDFVNDLFGGGKLPDNYDAKGELAKSEAMAGNVYDQAMAQSQAAARGGAPSSAVTAQQLAQPGQLTAQTIGTPDTLAGMQAADLRAQQLGQAAAAAASPSAAAAQMRGAAGLISNQQLGQAAMARGGDRATARRDAMLATGTQGMVAANQSAALAAAEQAAKQQAYTQALTGVRAGDVAGAQAQTQIGAANQGANLQAQSITEANKLEAAKANQSADLDASKYTAGNTLDAWTAQQQAINAANATANQSVGAQNQAQGTAATYGTGQNEAAMKNKGAVSGLVGGIVGGLLSDERAKTDVYQIDQPKPEEPYDFLDWEPPKPEESKESPGLLGGILSAISDERVKADVYQQGLAAGAQAQGGQPQQQPAPGGIFGRAAQTIGVVGQQQAQPGQGGILSKAQSMGMFGQQPVAPPPLQPAPSPAAPVAPRPTGFAGLLAGPQSPLTQRGAQEPPAPAPAAPAPGIFGRVQSMGAFGGGGATNPKPTSIGGAAAMLSDERVKTDTKRLTAADETADLLRSAYGITDDGNPYGAALSDERTKREVDRMAPDELVNWAEDVPMVTFRYKDGAPGTDGGEDYHLGTLAQSLERTGPMGRLMVHERDDGLKEVDYGPLALAIAKAALVKAGQKGGR